MTSRRSVNEKRVGAKPIQALLGKGTSNPVTGESAWLYVGNAHVNWLSWVAFFFVLMP